MRRITRDERPPLPVHARLLWDATDVAQALGFGRSLVYDLLRAKVLPLPVEIGDGSRRWRANEIRDWVNAGCPHRGDWTWRPSLPAKLDDLIRARTEEVGELEDELRELRALRASGQTTVTLRARYP